MFQYRAITMITYYFHPCWYSLKIQITKWMFWTKKKIWISCIEVFSERNPDQWNSWISNKSKVSELTKCEQTLRLFHISMIKNTSSSFNRSILSCSTIIAYSETENEAWPSFNSGGCDCFIQNWFLKNKSTPVLFSE